jgi:hypothetical protein
LDNFAHAVFTGKVSDIDGELHQECMNTLAWIDPQALAGKQLVVFQKPGPSLATGASPSNAAAQYRVSRCISNLYGHGAIAIFALSHCGSLPGSSVKQHANGYRRLLNSIEQATANYIARQSRLRKLSPCPIVQLGVIIHVFLLDRVSRAVRSD